MQTNKVTFGHCCKLKLKMIAQLYNMFMLLNELKTRKTDALGVAVTTLVFVFPRFWIELSWLQSDCTTRQADVLWRYLCWPLNFRVSYLWILYIAVIHSVCVMKLLLCMFCTIFSAVTTSWNIIVLTGLFLALTVCVFMINSNITELHNKPVAACAEGSMCVIEVKCLLVSMCVLSRGEWSSPEPYKTVLLDFALCKFVYCPPAPTLLFVFLSFVDSVHYVIGCGGRKMFETSQTDGVLFSVTASLNWINHPGSMFGREILQDTARRSWVPSPSYNRLIPEKQTGSVCLLNLLVTYLK